MANSMSGWTLTGLLAITLIVSQVLTAATLETVAEGTVLSKPANTQQGDVPDYGEFGYIYAPALIREGQTTKAWICGGLATTMQYQGADHILATSNWSNPEPVLCPADERSRTSISRCVGQAPPSYDAQGRPDSDFYQVCDPSVIRFNNQYYLYYTAAREGGNHNQVFLARSADGLQWQKYPGGSSPAIPVVGRTPIYPPAPFATGYGVGESSVVVKDGKVYMYYTDFPYFTENNIFRASSTDGINFGADERMFAEKQLPWASEGIGGVEVRYVSGWNVWFMVHSTASKKNLTWNISRDGVHWLPYDEARVIAVSNIYATGPGIEGDGNGWVGDGTIGSQTIQLVYTTTNQCPTVSGCFHTWTLDSARLILSPEQLRGTLESVDSSLMARGWAYDPDTGTNDAASNGSPTAPLGHDTWVRPVAVRSGTGQRFEGSWRSAGLPHSTIVAAEQAPDRYHGFAVDLRSMKLGEGTYTIQIEGGEFPTGGGARQLAGQATITCPSMVITQQPQSLTIDNGSSAMLAVGTSAVAPNVSFQWYRGASGVTSDPIQNATAYWYQTPELTSTANYWVRITSKCGTSMDSTTATVTVLEALDYVVSLQSYYGYFVGADDCGGAGVHAYSHSTGECERWILRDLNGGSLMNGDQVTLRAANGMYMVAEEGGSSVVNANRTNVGDWEMFTMIDTGGYPYIWSFSSIALLSHGSWNGQSYFVVAEGGGGGDVNCNRSEAREWETFVLMIH